MSSALSSAYVLLGKATMSDPPDWSTAVGAIHSLSSLLTCSICNGLVGPRPHATPNDSYSLICDKCDHPIPSDQDEIINLLMENIKNLCSYALKAFQHVPKIEDDSDDDSETAETDVVIVPTQSSQGKFVSKLRRFSKVHFGLEQEIITPALSISPPALSPIPALPHSPVPKAVIVTSPAKPNLANGSRPGQWIKVHHTKPAGTKRSSNSSSLIKINGNKFGRDQIVKTTLRPSLNFSPAAFAKHQTGSHGPQSLKLNDLNNKLNDFVVKLEEMPTKVITAATSTALNTGEIQEKIMINNKKGCRCGNATPAPGKLTCGGQRCPCYVGSRSCIDCKCKGCRNPHQINGIKVIRPHLQVKSLTSSNSQSATKSKLFTVCNSDVARRAPNEGAASRPAKQSSFYISSSPLVSQKPSSMTTIRRIHLK